MKGNVASAPHLRRTGIVLTIVSVAAVLIATLSPASDESMAAHFCIVCGPLGGVDVVLNVFLFLPLGVGLALSGVRWRRAVFAACCLSILVELAQLFFVRGRDATLGDVVMNTVGASLGVALVLRARTWLRPAPRSAAVLSLSWCMLWLGIQLVASFALALSIPDSTFYGEIARQLGNFDLFRGRVVAASIDSVAITDAPVSDEDDIARRLRGGAQVRATVVPLGPTRGIAPIVRVADADQRQIVLLAQKERVFLFGARTGAETLRLRAPLIGLEAVFPATTQASDTVTLTGRYLSRAVSVGAQSGSAKSGSDIPLFASLAWTLLLPSQWFIEGTAIERLLSLIWVAVLLVPVGYWAPYAARRLPGGDVMRLHTFVWPTGIAIIAVGLAVGPLAFGLTPTPPADWVAAFLGLLTGIGLGRATGKPRLA